MQPVSRVVDLLDPSLNRLSNMDVETRAAPRAQRRSGGGPRHRGSFALVAHEGRTVRLARSLDRPMRYFLAKRHEGPALYVADRIDTLHRRCRRRPRRPVPSELHAHGAGPLHRRSRARRLPGSRSDLHALLHARARHAAGGSGPDRPPLYRRARRRNREVASDAIDAARHAAEPIGVAFSGGIDSGSVFLVTYHAMLRLGLAPSRLKAFVLNFGERPRRRPGARLPVGSRPVAVPRGDRGQAGRPRRLRDAARARGLQDARRRVRRDGAAAVPRHSRALSGVAISASTATAATRT